MCLVRYSQILLLFSKNFTKFLTILQIFLKIFEFLFEIFQNFQNF